MKRSYFLLRMREYWWIILTCMLLSIVVGLVLLKLQPQVYQVSSTMYVVAGDPGDAFNQTLSATDSVGLAANYSSQIMSRSVMQYVYQANPEIKARGFGPDDMLAAVAATSSTTSSTIMIAASAVNPNDAVMIANDIAKSFQSYIQIQRQQTLDTERKNLQNQYAAVLKQKGVTEASLLTVASNADPHFGIYNNDLADETHTLDTLQSQLISLPVTARSDVVAIQFAAAKDAVQAVKANQILAATAGIGLLVGLLITLLVISLNKRLMSGAQVREKLGLAYLGSVSKSQELRRKPMQASAPIMREVANVAANLRLTNILPKQWRAPHGVVLLVTSARSAEGKTLMTSVLATAIARSGNTVVVIDGNLRQPSTHLAFGINTAGIGLSNLLNGSNGENAETFMQRSAIAGLWLLPAGAPVADAALLMGQIEQKMPSVLTQLRKRVDVIIIDGPSLLSGAEASVWATMADGVALIVDARHDNFALLQRAKEVLSSLTQKPIGVIMNCLTSQGDDNYYAVAATTKTPEWVTVPVSSTNGNSGEIRNVQRPEPVIAEPARNIFSPTAKRSVTGPMMLPSTPQPQRVDMTLRQ